MVEHVEQGPTIDVHAHVVLESGFGAAGAHGPELGTSADGAPYFRVGGYRLNGVAYRNGPFMDLELRLERMDRAGIDFQVLSPNPLTYFHFVGAGDAANFCRRHNEGMAELVARHPARLAGFAALPMQDPNRAIAELRHAVRTLGLVGAYVGCDFGVPLDSPALDPFYAACVELDVPLFFHPAPAGIDGPPGDARLSRFDLELTAGFAADETLTAATLILGGVLERHPSLDICLSHGGGAIPWLAERFACAVRRRPWVRPSLREGGFEAQLRRLWFDGHVGGPRALAWLEAVVGTERIVPGTNFAGWDDEERSDLALRRPGFSRNAARLLRLERRARAFLEQRPASGAQ